MIDNKCNRKRPCIFKVKNLLLHLKLVKIEFLFEYVFRMNKKLFNEKPECIGQEILKLSKKFKTHNCIENSWKVTNFLLIF